jgi:capsular polysaccharide transport system ATP-binding protein
MILFDDVWKFARKAKDPSLSGVNCVFERGANVAILCERDRDAEFLVNLFSGADTPDRGRIIRRGRISWPVGTIVSSKQSLTVRDNLRFLARIYGVDVDSYVRHIDDMVDFGKSLNRPLSELERPARLMTAYAAVLAIPFDWYILTSEIRASSREATTGIQAAFRKRFTQAGAIIITEDIELALAYGEAGVLFRDGAFHVAENVEQAARLLLRNTVRQGGSGAAAPSRA